MRCERCDLIRPLCYCGDVQARALGTRIKIIMHVREIPLTTNTAKLAPMFTSSAEILLRGKRGAPPLDCTDLVPKDGTSAVLFPSEDAETLDADWMRRHPGPVTLFVPDGNWKQCTKVARRTPGLENLPRVKLAPGAPSEYVLRKEPRPECVCTIEAVARALGVLEGPQVQADLEAVFRRMMDRTLFARGKLKPEQVRGGIPAEAIEFLRRTGYGKISEQEALADAEN